jgi:hypothetical protein
MVSRDFLFSSEETRDHPSTIKKRFFSVFVVMLVAPFFVFLFSSKNLFEQFTIWEVMGLRLDGILGGESVCRMFDGDLNDSLFFQQ